MKKLLFYALPAMLLLGACSEEVIVDRNLSTDQISFTAATTNTTRAIDSYCANNLPKDFTVWANTSDENKTPFIMGSKVQQTGAAAWAFEDQQYYWPNEGGLDFLAYRNEEKTFNGQILAPAFELYEIKDNVAEQLDLIYATAKNRTREMGAVNLNFRHALSQVVYRAKVSNTSLEVKINSVSICNLYNQGTFLLPTESETTTNWLDESHSDEQEIIEHAEGLGVWKNHDLTHGNGAEWASYTINTESAALVTPTSGTVSLSASPTGHAEGADWSKVMTLLPQEREALIPGSGNEGVYLKVNCVIYNSPTGEADKRTVLHNGDTYIPLAINWRQGIRYVYTINFGTGHAGYTDPDDPKPTLSPIEVTCTTDDFMPYEEITKDPAYTVNYYSQNGETLYMAEAFEVDAASLNKAREFNTLASLSEDTLGENVSLIGWSTVPNSKTPEFTPGEKVTFPAFSQTINLYAVTESKGVVFTVNFYEWVDNGDGNPHYELSTKYQPVKINKPAGTTSCTYELKEPNTMQPGNKPSCTNIIYTWDETTKYNCAEFIGWADSEANFKKNAASTTNYTMSAEHPVLNLYTAWLYHFGVQADYSCIGKNNRRYNSSGYYNQNPAMYENNASGVKSLWNTDYAKDGYAITGFSLTRGADGRGVKDADYYPVGTPIPVYPGETILTLYPVFE